LSDFTKFSVVRKFDQFSKTVLEAAFC
jgi:hypothetical protein